MEGEQVEGAPTEAPPDDSIRGLLTSQFEQARTEAALEADAAPAPAATAAETPAQAAERARDEKGRFAKGEPATQTQATTPAQTNLQKDAVTETPATATSAPSLDSLPHLTSDERAVLSKIDPAAQQIVARRLDDQHRKLSEYGRKVSSFREVEDAIAPRRQGLQAIGMSDTEWLKRVVRAADIIDATPVEGILGLMAQKGVTLEQLSQPQQQEDNSPTAQRLAYLEQQFQAQQQQAVTQQQTALSHAVDTFRTATDAQGKPLRPYLNDVATEFVPLVQAIRAARPDLTHEQVMQEAYDRAVHANPTTRQKLAEAARPEADARQRKAAAEAKTRGMSVVGSPGAGATPTHDGSIRGIIQAVRSGQL